jgi:hypothetical protein
MVPVAMDCEGWTRLSLSSCARSSVRRHRTNETRKVIRMRQGYILAEQPEERGLYLYAEK